MNKVKYFKKNARTLHFLAIYFVCVKYNLLKCVVNFKKSIGRMAETNRVTALKKYNPHLWKQYLTIRTENL